jgi:hypothetical protein
LNASAQFVHARSASSNRPSPPCRTMSSASCSTPMKSRWTQRHASRTHGRKRSPNSASVKSKVTDNDPKVGGAPIGRREPAVAIVLAMRASPSTTRMRISPESTPRRCHTKLRHFDQRPTRLLWIRTDWALKASSLRLAGACARSVIPHRKRSNPTWLLAGARGRRSHEERRRLRGTFLCRGEPAWRLFWRPRREVPAKYWPSPDPSRQQNPCGG